MSARFQVEVGLLPARSQACPIPDRVALLDMVDAPGRLGPEFDDVVGRLGFLEEYEVVLINVPGTSLEAAFVFEVATGRIIFLDLQKAGTLDAAQLAKLARQATKNWGPFKLVAHP